jgi:type VI protein secretion system component VasF
MSDSNQKIQSESKGRGGARAGAGRKAGAATVKTREIADRMMEEGISPLEYMLNVMRRATVHEDVKIQIARETMAFEAAKAAAPYVHPRLSAIEVAGKDGGAMESVTRIEFVGVSPK